MGGALDSARFKYRLAEAMEAPISDIDGMVIGGHSDTGMVPLTSHATRNSIKVSEFLLDDRLQSSGRGYESGRGDPDQACWVPVPGMRPGRRYPDLVQAIACDQKKMFPCSTMLEGEYDLDDICIGVPVILGRDGIEKIVDIPLSDAEKSKMQESAEGVKKTNGLLEL